MKLLRIAYLGALLFLLSGDVAAAGEHAPAKPVALVYSLAGEASLAGPDEATRSLRLFDRLSAGTSVKVGPGSRLALAFITGRRYELGEGSRVALGRKDLAFHSGPVRALTQLPPWPCLSPIAAEDRPGLRAGAVRIRAEKIPGLYPRRGAAVLPGEILLRFQPVTGAGRYRVEVQDDHGWTVFQTDIESPPVKIPSGKLGAGVDYRWTVRTLDRPGAVARGEAELVVLGEDAARARETASEILESEKPESLALLAEIDRSLGLLLEGREDLRGALDGKPADPSLREALAELDARLEHEDDRE